MVQVALVGLGNIASRVAEGIQKSSWGCLYAVVSGSSKKAARFFRLWSEST